MNLIGVTTISNGPAVELIWWLQGRNLLANPLRCVPCNQLMELTQRKANHMDGYMWCVKYRWISLLYARGLIARCGWRINTDRLPERAPRRRKLLAGNSFDFNFLKSPLLGFLVIQTGFSPVLVTSDEALQLGKIFFFVKNVYYVSLLAVISNSSNLLG